MSKDVIVRVISLFSEYNSKFLKVPNKMQTTSMALNRRACVCVCLRKRQGEFARTIASERVPRPPSSYGFLTCLFANCVGVVGGGWGEAEHMVC